jgi:hypothetical protein
MDDEDLINELLASPDFLDGIEIPNMNTDKIDMLMAETESSMPTLLWTESIGKEEAQLLSEISDQIKLESKQDNDSRMAVDEFAERVKKLKDFKPRSLATTKLGDAPKPVEISDFCDETENWCCICNEDGHLRCEDCDLDVYCSSCFKQGHPSTDLEFSKHRIRKLS